MNHLFIFFLFFAYVVAQEAETTCTQIPSLHTVYIIVLGIGWFFFAVSEILSVLHLKNKTNCTGWITLLLNLTKALTNAAGK
jgi:hypothetical protein